MWTVNGGPVVWGSSVKMQERSTRWDVIHPQAHPKPEPTRLMSRGLRTRPDQVEYILMCTEEAFLIDQPIREFT